MNQVVRRVPGRTPSVKGRQRDVIAFERVAWSEPRERIGKGGERVTRPETIYGYEIALNCGHKVVREARPGAPYAGVVPSKLRSICPACSK